MGGRQSSENVTEVLNEAIIDASQKHIQNCAPAALQHFEFIMDGEGDVVIHGDLRQSQVVNIDTKCIQNTDIQQDLQTEIENKIKQNAEIQTLLPPVTGETSAKNRTKLISSVAYDLALEFEQNCKPTTAQTQTVRRSNTGDLIIYGSVDMSQESKNAVECMTNNKAVQKVITKYSNTVDQTAKNSNNFIADIFDSLFGNWQLVLIIIAVVIFLMFFNPSGGQQQSSE